MAHYAEAFSPEPGRCFRFVSRGGGSRGAPTHCPAPAAYRGTFKDRSGKVHHVEACIQHAGDVIDAEAVDVARQLARQ